MLASASPRRRELLAQLGIACRICPVDIDEAWRQKETAQGYVSRLARDKAVAAWNRLPADEHLPVLGADTCVTLDGRIYGKPANEEEARAMLAALSGRTHEVLTAVCLVSDNMEETVVSRSFVTLRTLNTAEITAYTATGEPLDKAGAYAIQGMGAVFVAHLDGSYSGVMGLPLYETAALLGAAGIAVPPSLEHT